MSMPLIYFYKYLGFTSILYFIHLSSIFRGAILVFAIIGTLISVVSVTGILYLLSSFIPSPPHFRVLDLMYFGAIISATDPVTVLTIFQVNMPFYKNHLHINCQDNNTITFNGGKDVNMS